MNNTQTASRSPLPTKKAIIAGGGIAGLAAAVMLDELGYHITLIEKKSILGGRAYSFTDKKTGIEIDNGQHVLMGAYHETIQLLERVGAKHKIEYQIPTKIPLLSSKGKKNLFCLNNLPQPLNLAMAIIRFNGFSFKEKMGLLKLVRELKKIQLSQHNNPQDQTIQNWLSQFDQTKNSIDNFWEILTLATLNDHTSVLSADNLAKVLIQCYFTGQRDGFIILPNKPLSQIFANPIKTYLEMRGHKITPKLGLQEVLILDNKVQGFRLSDQSTQKADLYVSALPHQSLKQVLPKTFQDLKNISQFKNSPITSINLFFDKPIMSDPFIGLANSKIHWFFNKEPQPQQSPPLYHIAGLTSGSYDFLAKNKAEIVRIAVSDLEKAYPKAKQAKLVHSLVNIERHATLSCQLGINAQRPSQRIFDNFFVIGDWTQTHLPTTIESATLSAKQMIKSLLNLNRLS